MSAHPEERRGSAPASASPPPAGLTNGAREARRAEARRKAVHVSMILFALPLRWLSWKLALLLAAAAVLFNLRVLPQLGGEALLRERERGRGWAAGIVLYPVAVLGLVLAFRESLAFVAIGWALLAVGDGMAGLVGRSAGRRRLPWNPSKTWEGVGAFVLFGTVAAFILARWVGDGLPALTPWPDAVQALALPAACLAAACVAALVESLDSGIDDNLLVPWLGAGTAWLLLSALSLWPERAAEAVLGRVVIFLVACLVLAVIASLAGSITRAGGLAGVVVGTLIGGFGGVGAFACLVAFFVMGSGATKVGRQVKEERGIAEDRGGRRSVGNVLANGGVAAAAALLFVGGAGPAARHWGSAAGDLPAWLAEIALQFEPVAPLPILAGIALVAALATATFDTVSSEVGKAHGRRTFRPTTGEPVPPGTEGAVSLEGTAAGLAAAFVLALVGWAGGLLPDASALLAVVVGAIVGTTFESVVGTWADARGHLIDGHVLNFANTLAGALAAVAFYAA